MILWCFKKTGEKIFEAARGKTALLSRNFIVKIRDKEQKGIGLAEKEAENGTFDNKGCI